VLSNREVLRFTRLFVAGISDVAEGNRVVPQ
jgi:hypothetical protein